MDSNHIIRIFSPTHRPSLPRFLFWAEAEGFEPSEPCELGTLAMCCFRPLNHTSFRFASAKVDRADAVFLRSRRETYIFLEIIRRKGLISHPRLSPDGTKKEDNFSIVFFCTHSGGYNVLGFIRLQRLFRNTWLCIGSTLLSQWTDRFYLYSSSKLLMCSMHFMTASYVRGLKSSAL